jgi:hypothetical protein
MRKISYLFILLGILTACGGNAQPVITTFQPTNTLPATETMAAPTAAVIAAVSHPTQAATVTEEPTTPTPGPSPTSLLAPTVMAPPQTQAATRAATLSSLQVEYFTTDTEAARPGDNVTLFWSTRGADTVRLYRVNADEERISRWDVPVSGQLTVSTRSGDQDMARFLLVAENEDNDVEQTLSIPMSCADLWFFDPAPDACAADLPQVSNQAEQVFERGRMIWIENQDQIYVIFEDGGSPGWATYPDNFSEGEPERDDSLAPPAGMDQPIRGFGLVWRTNTGVRDRLGWATSPEIPYEGMYQMDSTEATMYLRARDSNILALNAETDEWEVMPVGTPVP